MQAKMQVIAVNIGKREQLQIGSKSVATGIMKRPTEKRVAIGKLGLAGDVIVSKKHHGGPDQAVYLYSRKDYDWWEQELGREIASGMFGENVTVTNLETTDLKIGDRFRINDVLVEVTFGRVPCSKFATRMGNPNFIKQFVAGRRPGVYLRVLETGTIQVGDAVEFVPAEADYPTVNELFDAWYKPKQHVESLQRGLEAPVSERSREAIKRRLAKITT